MKSATRLSHYFSPLVLVIAVMPLSASAHFMDLSLSGFGTATIDGVLSDGEWDSAETVLFNVNTLEGGTVPGRLQVMNNEIDLFMSIDFAAIAERNSASIEFDNNHDGVLNSGDDGIIINPEIGFMDLFRDWPYSYFDTDRGGTNDGAGAFSNAGGHTVYEFSHPLDSADDAHDFSLSIGDTVGFTVGIRLQSGSSWVDTRFPESSGFPSPYDPTLYGNIVIAAVPVPPSLYLFGAGLLGLIGVARRKKAA